MIRYASFSECGNYRYSLYREWHPEKPKAMCIGLNPSTANSKTDDPTIRLLIKHLQELGYGAFYMVNLYPIVSSDPKILSEVYQPSEENNSVIENLSRQAQVIFCWGDFSEAWFPSRKWIRMFPDALCFGKTKAGNPVHPRKLMYLKGFEKATLRKFK